MITRTGIHSEGTAMRPEDPIAKAKKLLVAHIDRVQAEEYAPEMLEPYEVYVVLFAYILGGWKAVMATDMSDGMYYELTYNAAKQETYIDEYQKRRNVTIQDNEFKA